MGKRRWIAKKLPLLLLNANNVYLLIGRKENISSLFKYNHS